MKIRIEQYDAAEVLYVAIDPDGVWARSDFPTETITVDYDAEGKTIGLEVAGTGIAGIEHDIVEIILKGRGFSDEEQAAVKAAVSGAAPDAVPST
jgi:uncharacterized protein YuzE